MNKEKLLYKSLLAPLLFFCNSIDSQVKYNTGLLIDSVRYNKIETISKALKFNESIQDVFSLKAFCPKAGNQNPLGTCASWATGYSALTISYAIENNLVDKNLITKNAKSAMYLYNQIGNMQTCSGSYIDKNLTVCKLKGNCDFSDFNPSTCQVKPTYEIDLKAEQFKIQEFYKLFPLFANSNQKISSVINALNSNKPVIVSLKVFNELNYVSKNGIYKPKFIQNGGSAHAVCLIGYNNILKEFEFINSWGEKWGDNGFFKMSYEDFARDCIEAYQFSLANNNKPSRILNGTFELLEFSKINNKTGWPEFISTSAKLIDNGFYTLTKRINKDDFFRLRAKNLTVDSYIYIITQKPNKKVEILFPLNSSISNSNSQIDIPLITSSKSSIELPEDINNGYSTDISGEDNMIILFSKKRINNIGEIAKDLEMNLNISIWLKKSFGNSLVDPKLISFNKDLMSFSTNPYAKGDIVPIILNVLVK